MSDEWLTTEDELRLPARWWRTGEAPSVVVLVHGFAAHRAEPAVVATAEALHGAGYDVLAYDARGHGEAEGLCTLGHLERLDVAAAVTRAARDHESIVVVGASMGAVATLRFAASDAPLATRLHGVVTISSPARWRAPRTPRSAAAALLTQTAPGRALARRTMNVRLARGWSSPESPVELVRSIEVPLALVHGRRDRFIVHDEAAVLAGHAVGPVRLEVVDEMGHAFDPRSHGPVGRALEWCLKAQPGPLTSPDDARPA